ncbi:hypothetical protein I553_8549 [Mycobacterium xenopi 4042]|uniref:Uncharacterized protein n=1 Tax=Mycobacterium xenopi 4042 TaxID=1299334 RepID=X8CKY4_MYCXE|nr:hypothetical protein I553_8549 [Mycobacterium xenopi 4042]
MTTRRLGRQWSPPTGQPRVDDLGIQGVPRGQRLRVGSGSRNTFRPTRRPISGRSRRPRSPG